MAANGGVILNQDQDELRRPAQNGCGQHAEDGHYKDTGQWSETLPLQAMGQADEAMEQAHENAESSTMLEDRSTDKTGGDVTYDSMLSAFGHFGRYQKFVLVLVSFHDINLSIQLISSVFIMAVPLHRCALPWLNNDTWATQSALHSHLVNASVPPTTSEQHSCRLYSHASSGYWHGTTPGGNASNATWTSGALDDQDIGNNTVPCNRYVYDTSIFSSTISSELNLVCETSMYRTYGQMMVMLGCLVGSQLSGVLADIWGRKVSMMIFMMLDILCMYTMIFVQHYIMLLALMFLTGMAALGCVCAGFVLSMEIVGPSKRLWTGVMPGIFFGMGTMLLTVLAYFLRDWQHLQIACATFSLPYLAYWWLVPESPRWLLIKGRVEEAKVALARLARVNKMTFTPVLVDKIVITSDAQRSLWRVCISATRLLGRHLIIFFSWFVASFSFYGLNYNVGTLAGNVYINMVLAGLSDIVALAIGALLIERLGRRPLISAMYMVAGVACAATIFPVVFASQDKQWITVVLALIGKCGIAGAFSLIWLYSSELFPTVMRNSATGAASLCARAGGIVAPYIAQLDPGGAGGKAVPLVIFGIPSIVVALLLLCLPETTQRPLPETVEDALKMGRKNPTKTPQKV